MRVLIVLAAVLLVLVLLSLLRLGVQVDYGPPGLRVRLKLGPIRFQVYPRRPKKHEKEPRQEEMPAGGEGSLAGMRRFLSLFADTAGQFRRKVRIDRLCLDFTAAAFDPAAAALVFGGANAAIGMLWPLVEQNFTVKDRRIRTRVDFAARRSTVELQAAATLTVGQTLLLGLRLLLKARPMLAEERRKNKSKEQTQKEAV